jgi:hypothetical protein
MGVTPSQRLHFLRLKERLYGLTNEERGECEEIEEGLKKPDPEKKWHPNMLKLAFRRLKLKEKDIQEEVDNFFRASGDCICPECGMEYRDHPRVDTMDWLVVTCEWKVVKL